MAHFGVGPTFAAQCETAPVPDGWQAWTDANGPIPDALVKRAQAIAGDLSVPLGATESYPLPGVVALIRIEPRVWDRDAKGNLTQGCFRVGAVFLPSGSASVTPPTSDGTGKLIGALTAISLVVGTTATIVHLKRDK